MKIMHYIISLSLIFSISNLAGVVRHKKQPIRSPITRVYPNPTIGLNFTTSDAQNCRAAVIAAPQNPTAAVGPTQFISCSYPTIRSFNKFTGQPDGILNIDATAFTGNANAGLPFGANDVWMIYHPFLQRWIFSCETTRTTAFTGPTALEFIVSDSAIIIPTTQWAPYTLPPAQVNPNPDGALDFQQPAFDQNAYYIGVSTYADQAETIFEGSSLVVVSNSSILAGSPNITVFKGLFNNPIFFTSEGTATPASNFDTNPQYGYFVWPIYSNAGISGNTIQLYRILNAGSNTPTLGPLVTIIVPEFAYNTLCASHKGNLFGAAGALQTDLGEIRGVHVRNHQLYLCQDIQIDDTGTADTAGDRIGIRWYQFDLTGDITGQGNGTENPDTVPVLIQSGTLFDDSASDPLFYYLSSMMTNSKNDMVISFNVSGNNAFVNTGYAFRAASDTPNELRTPVTVTNSQFPLNFNANIPLLPGGFIQRWGDQSTVSLDSSDNTTFWINQPWAALQNAWGIQATQLLD